MMPDRRGRWVFAAVLFFGLLAMTARGAGDPDLWWHLRTGEWIVEAGRVPQVDPFSFTRAGHAWVSHEWLAEVGFYEIWKHLGFAGLIGFSAVVTTAGFMLLYGRCRLGGSLHGSLPGSSPGSLRGSLLGHWRGHWRGRGPRHWAPAATALGALAAAPSWGVRPQMFTFTLASLLLWLLERGEDRPRLLLWIPPLFLLWVNLHAGFALGLALLLAYGAGLGIEMALGSGARPADFLSHGTARRAESAILGWVGMVFVVCLLLVPLNPNGRQLYLYPLETLRSAGMRSLIGEWFSPDFHDWLYRPLLLVWLLLLAALAGGRARPTGRVMVPLLLTGLAGLDAVRHIPIFILLAMPVIAAGVPASWSGAVVGELSRPRSPSPLRPYFVGAVVVLMAILAGVKWTVLARNQAASEGKEFPEKAVSFLRAGNYPRHLFVYYDWGGYAVWRLYPRYRVFVDGRADLYGDELLGEFKTAMQLRTGWKEVLNRWQVDAVLVPPSSALAQGLLLDEEWHAGFADAKAILLLRGRAGVEEAEGFSGRFLAADRGEFPAAAESRH